MEELADLVKLHYMFYKKQNYEKYLPKGVSVLNQYSDDDSMVFIDDDKVIISMRGLDPSSLRDLQIGFNIVRGDVLNPRGFDMETSKGLYKSILDKEQQKIEELEVMFPNRKIELVGHSRGGRKAIDLGKHNDIKYTAFNPGDATSFRQKLYSVFLSAALPKIDNIEQYNDMLMNMPEDKWGLYELGNQRLFEHMENPFSQIKFEPKIIPQEYNIGQMIERLVYNPSIYEGLTSSAVMAATSVGGVGSSFATQALTSLAIPAGLELLYSATMGKNTYHGDAHRFQTQQMGTRQQRRMASAQMNRDEFGGAKGSVDDFKDMKAGITLASLPVNPSNEGTKNIYATANDIVSWGYKGKSGENVNIVDNKDYVKGYDVTHHGIDHFISRQLFNRIENDKSLSVIDSNLNIQHRYDREQFEASSNISASNYNTQIGNPGGQPRRPLDVKSFCEEYPGLIECRFQAGTL
jgi:hypothetical protein